MPDEVLPVIGRFFPLFRVVDVDAGHWVVSENPARFRRGMIIFFLSFDTFFFLKKW